MRLICYLTEADVPIEHIYQVVTTDCKPYFKEIRRWVFPKRGTPWKTEMQIKKMKVRKDRKSRFIPNEYTKPFDDIFKKRIGFKARTQGLFTGSHSVASAYGKAIHNVIPIGQYRYGLAKGESVNTLYNFYDQLTFGELPMETGIERMKSLVYLYKTSGLRNSLDTKFECIFDCDSYYIVDDSTITKLEGMDV